MGISAFRRPDGSVVVLAGNQNNYYFEGPSVEKAARATCANLVKPVNAADPSQFMARRWLMAIYAKRDDFALGFVHNEYHGNDFFGQGCKKTSQRDFECWYGSSGLVVSRDGGFTFETPAPPANVLATPPSKFETGRKRVGANTPKVVGNPHDGKVYVLISYLDGNRGMPANQCVLRGSGLALDDWRAWDGKDFTINMGSPYSVQRGGDCTAVLRLHARSVRYVPAIDRFVVLGMRGGSVVYAFSKDLINWSDLKTLMDVGPRGQGPKAAFYFSLLDPTSSSRNFDTLEGSPYLFFVRMVEGHRRATDIYRIPVTIK